MVTKKTTRKNYFDIHAIIARGTSDVRRYMLPFGEVIYRPISQLEFEEANAVMLSYIKDPFTKQYIFDMAENNELDKANDAVNKIDANEIEKISDFPPEINFAEMYQGMIYQAIHVVYLAIRDFTDDFKEADLFKVEGIRDFADEIMRISGNNKETQEDIASFRK